MQQGWYFIKLEDKKSSKPPSFEQTKQAICADLTQRKQFEYLSQIAKIIIQ